jgi:Fe-S cluster assembly protein SufD
MIEATQAKKDTDPYLSSFAQLQKELEGKQPPWLQQIRQAAISRFSDLGFPTSRQEEWKYTKVDPIRRTLFRPAAD